MSLLAKFVTASLALSFIVASRPRARRTRVRSPTIGY